MAHSRFETYDRHGNGASRHQAPSRRGPAWPHRGLACGCHRDLSAARLRGGEAGGAREMGGAHCLPEAGAEMTPEQQLDVDWKLAEQFWGEITPEQFRKMLQQMNTDRILKHASVFWITMPDVHVERRVDWALKFAMAFLSAHIDTYFA